MAAGTPEGSADQQYVTAADDVFQMAVQTLNTDLASGGASQAQIWQDLQAVEVALLVYLRAEVNYLRETNADQGGSGPFFFDLDNLFSILGQHGRE